jgi:hypothetical protein
MQRQENTLGRKKIGVESVLFDEIRLESLLFGIQGLKNTLKMKDIGPESALSNW